MNNEIKEYLDKSNYKFKEIDENGNEIEISLSEMLENLLDTNKRLSDCITNLQEENKKLLQKSYSDDVIITKAIPMLKELNIKIKEILKIGIDIKEISDIEEILKGENNEKD